MSGHNEKVKAVKEFFEQFFEEGKIWPQGIGVTLRNGDVTRVYCVLPRKAHREFCPVIFGKNATYDKNGDRTSLTNGHASDYTIVLVHDLNHDQRFKAHTSYLIKSIIQTLNPIESYLNSNKERTYREFLEVEREVRNEIQRIKDIINTMKKDFIL